MSSSSPISPEISVWDPLIRLFHWALVLAFCTAYFTKSEAFEGLRDFLFGEEGLKGWHVKAGYTILGLLIFRLVWGIVGPKYARFQDFVHRPSTVFSYTKAVLTFKAERHIGHNPAGGLMIVVMLLSLLATVTAGLVILGADKGAGPLAGLLANSSEALIDFAGEMHEFFGNFTVILVIGHLIGVVWESRLHGENLTKAMFTGRKRA